MLATARVPGYHCLAKFGYAWVALDDMLLPLLDAEEEALGYRRVQAPMTPITLQSTPV